MMAQVAEYGVETPSWSGTESGGGSPTGSGFASRRNSNEFGCLQDRILTGDLRKAAAAAEEVDDTEDMSCPQELRQSKSNSSTPPQSPGRLKAAASAAMACAYMGSETPLAYSAEVESGGNVVHDSRLEFAGEIDLLPDEITLRLRHTAVQVTRIVLQYPVVHTTIQTLKISPNTRVFARVTTNGWESHEDIEGRPSVPQGHEHGGQQSFVAPLPFDVERPLTLMEFAICLQVDGAEFWDNNHGRNYHVQIVRRRGRPRSRSIPKRL